MAREAIPQPSGYPEVVSTVKGNSIDALMRSVNIRLYLFFFFFASTNFLPLPALATLEITGIHPPIMIST